MKTSEVTLRPRRGPWLHACIAFAAFCICFVAPEAAFGGEGGEADAKRDEKKEEPTNEERFEKLEDDFKQAKRKKDVEAMCELIDAAGDLFADCCDDADLQEDVLKWTGTAARGTRGEAIEVAVLEELAEIGDARGAKYIKRYLRQRDPDHASDTLKAAVEAAACVPDPSLVTSLLKIVEKSDTVGIVREAVFALGKFRDAKRYRKRIVDTLIDEARKVKPGARPRMRGSQEKLNGGSSPYGRESGPRARWDALSASVPVAMRELTGQDIRDIGEWMRVVKDHRGHIDELFQDDDA